MTQNNKTNPLAKLRTCKNKRDQHELIDYDYLDKLSQSDLEFLASFTEDYYEGSVPKDDDRRTPRGKRRNDFFSSTHQRTSSMQEDVVTPDLDAALDIADQINKKK